MSLSPLKFLIGLLGKESTSHEPCGDAVSTSEGILLLLRYLPDLGHRTEHGEGGILPAMQRRERAVCQLGIFQDLGVSVEVEI